ncbi:methyl-accepting chemotaxis protein [Radiobacillus kanasensis]|uniref:methyl-accepting chemotaxis protein n=1 Tax=Radiobacillus kanasensis TaxID=2844358 RepID=UPI001E6281E7|nr:HAMP domain-containing methyl-accepting chemotaxis protein [Radiobacillus kanasensis]UFT99576.1 methyl-accepting chemotaxis protein [Radiobacillus kanasensis]
MIKKLRFKNLTIGWKYGLILILIFLLFGIATTVVTNQVNNIGDNVDALERRGDRAIKITEMGSLTRSKSIRVNSYVMEQNQSYVDEYKARQEEFNTLEADVRSKMDSERELELFNQIVALDKELNDLFLEEIIPAAEAGENTDSLNDRAGELRSETVDLLQELRNIVNEQRSQAIDTTKESQELALIILIISMAASIIIGGILVILVSRVISRNLNRVVEVSNQIADGNLSVENVNYDGKDEIGSLTSAINKMSDNLRTIIRSVSDVSETVSSQSEELTQSAGEVKAGTQQIAATMQELATGAETQANNASDLTLTMKSFVAKVSDANRNGGEIFESSNMILGMTEDGSKLMMNSIQQMAKIDQIVKGSVEKVKGLDSQSQEISKLVSVIKDVAEQTNLLALNAAIEAARAGEHGKGFAVVADEVRKLAEQVADSVKDITEIVGSIQNESSTVVVALEDGYKEVEEGTNQIKTTGDTFNSINSSVEGMVSSIKSVTTSLSEISTSSQEMNTSIEEVASISEESAAGVEQTSASAQQASSSMEEISASSDELSKLADKLNGLVRQFTL